MFLRTFRLVVFIFVVIHSVAYGASSLKSRDHWPLGFIMIGSTKSGTGELLRWLKQHPQIVLSNSKEVHFFNNSEKFSRGSHFYKSLFPSHIEQGQIYGEKTPSYFVCPEAPKRVHSLFPNVKLILILRNPIDRAYSEYQHRKRNNAEKLSFEEALQDEKKRILRKKWDYTYRRNSIYINHINQWLKYFPKKQLLVIDSNEFRKDENKVVNQIYSFLGLPEFYSDGNFKHKLSSHYPSMNPATRKKLANFFHPYNVQLEKKMKMHFNWD